jgi:hypothetical protein
MARLSCGGVDQSGAYLVTVLAFAVLDISQFISNLIDLPFIQFA